MFKRLKSRKGIAPLTLVAFLVLMVVAVVFATYLWQNVVVKVANAIQIQGVLFKSSETIIYVQNVGDGTVTVVNAYIDGEKFDVNSQNSVVNQANTNVVPKGGTAEVKLAEAYDHKINIKVVCLDGTVIEGYYEPPL